MKCVEVREAMLEADPSVLAGEGDDPVSIHLRDCPRCRTAGEALLSDQAALGLAIADMVPDPDLDRILDLGSDAVDHQRSPAPPAPSRLRPALRWALLPIAAAAAAVALILPGEAPLPGEAFVPNRVADGLDIEVPAGRNVAVFETKNPEITVLWFF